MGKKIKIGHFVSFGVGGADKCAFNLILGLIALPDIENIVFYNKFSHPRQDELLTNPSRWENYSILGVPMIEVDYLTKLNDYGLDILQTHRPGNDTWALPNFENIQFNFKIVETNFHGYNGSKSDFRIYPSQAMVNFMSPSNIPSEIIPNPILLQQKAPKLEICKDKFVYGRIGRPDANIYSNINLQAYKEIETDDTMFLYVAPNSRAIDDAKNLGIKNIHFINPTVDEKLISSFYYSIDVLCHSNSLGETFGNTIAEGMMYGKPVISHIGMKGWPQAQPELLGDMKELFITDNLVTNYANMMNRLKNDNDFMVKTSLYLYKRAHELFSFYNVAKRYLDVYKKLLYE